MSPRPDGRRDDGLACGNCNAPLYVGHTLRRRVPRLGGRKRYVCRDCASAIDRQLPMELDVEEAGGAWRP